MKKVSIIPAIFISLFIMAGCGGNKQSTDGFITVDVTANYPKKELILQDFMDQVNVLRTIYNDRRIVFY